MATGARVTQQKAYTLDALRATAALLVLMLHIAPLAKPLGVDIPWNGVGTLGVHLFFVLSGYLITSAVLSRSYTPRRYALNRAFRILPAYFVALAVVLFLRDSTYLTSWGGLKDVLAHVFLLHIFFEEYRVSIHGVLWTLSIEWLFYGFMLLCAPLIRHPARRWWFVAGMFVVALVYRTWMWKTYTTNADLNLYAKQLPGMLDHFAAGTLAAMAMQFEGVRRFVQRRDVKTVGLAVSAVAVAVAVAIFHRYLPEKPVDGYWSHWFMVIPYPVLFCGAVSAFMIFIMQFETRLAPFIRRSGLGLVGVCSYSLYLFHTMVIGSFAACVAGQRGQPHDPAPPLSRVRVRGRDAHRLRQLLPRREAVHADEGPLHRQPPCFVRHAGGRPRQGGRRPDATGRPRRGPGQRHRRPRVPPVAVTPAVSRGRRWRCRGGGARSGPRTARGCGPGGRPASRAGPRWPPRWVRRWG